MTGKEIRGSQGQPANGNLGTEFQAFLVGLFFRQLSLPAPECLKPPAGDEVEALSAATGYLDVFLEPDFSRFHHPIQEASFRTGPGHVLRGEAITGVLPALGMEEVIRAVLPIPAPEPGTIGDAFSLFVPVGESG